MNQPDKSIPHVLVLGGGALAAELYAPAIVRLGREKEYLFVDVSQRSIDTLKAAFPGLRTHVGDYSKLFADAAFLAEFRGAVIALPNHLHRHSVTACLEAGLEVLCEKPLALDEATCLELASVAERHGRQLSVAMVRRLIPAVLTAKDALRAGLVGDLLSVEIQHGSDFRWPSESGAYFRPENGGLLVNMGVHYLDMLEDWLGPLTPVAFRDDFGGGAEANCDFRLVTRAGASVRLKLSVTDLLENTVVIRGVRGELRFGVDNFDSVSWIGAEPQVTGELRSQLPFPAETGPRDFFSSFAAQFLEFEAAIAGEGAVRVTARDAARTHRLIDWAYRNRSSLLPPIHRAAPRPAIEPCRVTVTGGTGFLGVSLVERLNELGFSDIVIPVRSFRSGARAARFRVDRRLTDLRDPESVKKVVAGSRYVFHLAYGADGPDAARVTVESTKNVVEAAIAEGVETVVVTSTATVFGHPPPSGDGRDVPVDETFPYRPALGDYGTSKAEAEKYCLNRAKTSGRTRIVVINPASIYGPGGKLFTSLPIRAARDGWFGWINEGVGIINYAFVENVVDALVLAATCGEAHGGNFLVCDGSCTLREYLTPLLGKYAASQRSYTREEIVNLEKAGALGFRDLLRALMGPEVMRAINGIPVLSIPKKFVERRLGGMYAKAQTARSSLRASATLATAKAPSGIPPLWLADILGPVRTVYSTAKARKILGWEPAVPLAEGHRVSRAWLTGLGLLPDDGA